MEFDPDPNCCPRSSQLAGGCRGLDGRAKSAPCHDSNKELQMPARMVAWATLANSSPSLFFL